MKKTAKLLGILVAASLVLSSLVLVAGAGSVEAGTKWDFAIGGENNPFAIYDHPHGSEKSHLADEGREANFASKTASTATYSGGTLALANSKMNLVFFTAPENGVYSYKLTCTGNDNAGNCNIYYFAGNDTDGYKFLEIDGGNNRHDPQSGTQLTFTLDIALKQGDSLVIGIGNWWAAQLTVAEFSVTYVAEHKYTGGECVLCGKEGWSYSLDANSGFTTYDHPHGGPDAHLAAEGREANFASKSASTASVSNGTFVVAQQKMSLVYFTAPSCGTYALDLQITGVSNSSNCNVYYFIGNDTDGYTVLKDGDTVIRHDPADGVKRNFALNVALGEGDSLVIAIGNYWGAQIKFNTFDIAKTSTAHTGGTATCKTKAVCENCGESYGELDPANHESTENGYESIDENNHKVTYACCGATKTESEAHNNGNDNVCDNCGEGCNHSGGTASCTDKAICESCGTPYGDTLAHNYVDGFCTECGDEDVSYVPPVSPDTGDMTVTAVILGAIALISLAFAGAKKRR